MPESEEQIRALTELVQQLQAENNRLKDRGNETVNVEAPGPAGHAAANNFGSDLAGWVYMYAPRERKCPRFSGDIVQDGLTVEDWVEEAKKPLSVQHASLVEQATFLCDLLDGEAKQEVKFSSPESLQSHSRVYLHYTT